MFKPENSPPKTVQNAKNEFNQFGHQLDYDFVLKSIGQHALWLMRKIAEKLEFQKGTMVEVCQKAGNQPPIRIFSIIVAEISSR